MEQQFSSSLPINNSSREWKIGDRVGDFWIEFEGWRLGTIIEIQPNRKPCSILMQLDNGLEHWAHPDLIESEEILRAQSEIISETGVEFE